MRSNCALYIDVGYLLASAAVRVTGTSLRAGIQVEFPKLIDDLVRQAEELSGLPVLRVHWYDAAKNAVPDWGQGLIGELPKVKLRLGRIGLDGQQKGVDLRIGLDLVTHARNHVADIFYVVSGDDDLTEAVEEAQVQGVQVVILAVPNASGVPHAVSRHLLRAADQLEVVDETAIDRNVSRKAVTPRPVDKPGPKSAVPSPAEIAARVQQVAPPPTSVLAYSSSTGSKSVPSSAYIEVEGASDQIDAVAKKVADSVRRSATDSDLRDIIAGRPAIPSDVDRALLLDLSDTLEVYDLEDPLRFKLRERFWAYLADG
ncbi:NYN domain-containing protein [Rarobacter faecitabidus]|uniref:Uncharacterized LabA/DUF88 family protein n=1 Tax=Rarobacter faecitabidus TaxID=13243 RepID=A0A542ZV85_RARFA|nr:NYN domain-containing protein [Rarobacter faecitabidus]TQL64268.1 uncharacterized LabA/DUF88 family protein [Rarobacter faecitabidus]